MKNYAKLLILVIAWLPNLPAEAYIDPATGSMLFSVVLGVLTTFVFIFHSLWFKLKLIFNKKNLSEKKIPIVIYSEGKQYWSVFHRILDEFEKRNIQVVYYTSADDDPYFNENYKNIKGEFIGKGNKAFFKLAFLKADVCLMTTPHLDVLQLKRSKNVKHYSHILHSPSDSTRYKLFGLDYFDSILLNGTFQVEQIRELEQKRGLPPKELQIVGCSYLDDLQKRAYSLQIDKIGYNILVAPTWGESSLLNKYGAKLIDKLLETDKNIIIRPHPQSLKVEKNTIEKLQNLYKNNTKIKWDFSPDNLETLAISDIMISDFSGVIFDYAFIFNRPFIFINENINKEIYDFSISDKPLFALNKIKDLGFELKEENFDEINQIIENTQSDNNFSKKAEELKNLIWQEQGKSAENIVNFLVNKQKEVENAECPL